MGQQQRFDHPATRSAQTGPVVLRHGCGATAGTAVTTFFETFAPLEATGRPTVVMIHGGAHTGSCWMMTPDGRPGWVYDFVERGYPSIVPDWPGVGRSGAIPPDDQDFGIIAAGLGDVLSHASGPVILLTHSMGGVIGWAVAERHREQVAAVVAIAPGPPGNIQPEPRILARTETAIEIETPHRRVVIPHSGCLANDPAFIDAKLIGTGTQFPAEARGLYAASLLPVPASLTRQRLNVDGRQIRVADPGRYRDLPVLVVTGPQDLEHPRATDEDIVRWLRENGAEAEFGWLADLGIEGNGHMMMLEHNSRAIASLVCDWLDNHLPAVLAASRC